MSNYYLNPHSVLQITIQRTKIWTRKLRSNCPFKQNSIKGNDKNATQSFRNY